MKKDKYEASVIIPTYNRSKLLDFTLNSIALQDLPKSEFEVIIADDGSSDNTLEVVKSYEDKLNLKYKFQEDKGYRVASARNMGIRAAEGKICIFIDSGVLMNHDCISSHLKFYAEKGNVSVVGYVYGFDQGDGMLGMLKKMINPGEPSEAISKLASSKMFIDVRDSHYTTYNDQIQDLPAPWFYFWTCHVSAIRENIINVGMFDEQYDGKWGCEDNDLGLRLHNAGAKIHLLRSATVIHYPHYEDFEEKKKQGAENCIYFHDKFRTPETRLFLEVYTNPMFIDINAKSMHDQRLAATITE